MALDEPQEQDVILTEQDIKFVIDAELLEKTKPIKIDFIDTPDGSGFELKSNLPSGGGCGDTCSC
jgi:Fe-S cluster assembly iron-binding protein IscA